MADRKDTKSNKQSQKLSTEQSSKGGSSFKSGTAKDQHSGAKSGMEKSSIRGESRSNKQR
jgi:hypothetical protein